jgi:sulfoxide reductase heme-binding subunit YedZ
MKRANVKRLISVALAIPGALMFYDFAAGNTLAMDLLHPSGEFAVRLMILAMLPGPLVEAFGLSRFLMNWLMIRRNLGVAGFGYALLHLLFYAADMTPAGMLDELGLPAIWTGWLALALMIPPAAISFDAAVRTLGRKWQLLQRLVYAAFMVSLAHWLLLDWEWLPAALHLLPLALAWSLRLRRRLAISTHRSPA